MNKKDQEAIKHITSVSKNPHAALIAKQLLTGWPVKIKETGRIIDSPFDIKDCEYELIEPKLDKPAYKIYLYKGRKGKEKIGHILSKFKRNECLIENEENFICWLSDWIEYDPPKKWPTPLVERIAAIDIKAAEWIVDHWDDLLDERYSEGVTVGRESGRLCSMFTWSSSTQGKDYWYAISKKLGE